MVDLDSGRWKYLQHAYGPATETPAQLRRLSGGDDSKELRDLLWSSLWHQGNVYTASYAAVPHIIGAATVLPAEQQLEWLVLATGIIASRGRPGSPEVPRDLAATLEQAVTEVQPLVSRLLFASQWAADQVRYVLGVTAIAQGWPQLGLGLFDLDGGAACPSCAVEVDLLKHFGLDG